MSEKNPTSNDEPNLKINRRTLNDGRKEIEVWYDIGVYRLRETLDGNIEYSVLDHELSRFNTYTIDSESTLDGRFDAIDHTLVREEIEQFHSAGFVIDPRTKQNLSSE
jgi:hypothetical protein